MYCCGPSVTPAKCNPWVRQAQGVALFRPLAQHKMGERVTGNVIKVDNRGAWVDIGGKTPAFVAIDEVREAAEFCRPRRPSKVARRGI